MKYSDSRGIGLLEIMIALLISATLLAEIFRYSYFLEKTLHVSASNVETIEEINVLFAWMVRDIEMAGYLGCVNAQARENIRDDNHYLSPTWLIASGNILESQYMSTDQFYIQEKMSETEILISGDNNFKEGDVVVVENCWELETAKIKKTGSVDHGAQSKLEFYVPLKMDSFENTYVSKLIRHDYFIQNSLGLYVRNEKGGSDEVLEKISNFNISFSQGKYFLSLTESNQTDPIILRASAYNAS